MSVLISLSALSSVKRKIRPFYRAVRPVHRRLYNMSMIDLPSGTYRKKALLSYIVHPFFIKRGSPRFYGHINIWRTIEIVKVLNRLGYLVDVVDYRDTDFVPRSKYDLFIGHGGINFEKIAGHLEKAAVRIYFSTGSYWKFHNERELFRIEGLNKRLNIEYQPERLIAGDEETALRLSDAIIAVGNDFTRSTYAGFSSVTTINNTVLADSTRRRNKSRNETRTHFLFYAGEGNVHKGLDLLVEAFAGLDRHLWICSPISAEFKSVYSSLLNTRVNIHPVGKITPRSRQFYEVLEKCGFVILPSCSEGQAHSVLECMQYGLIPVVSRESGLDVDNFGLLINPCDAGGIRSIVEELSSLPVDRMEELAERTIHETRMKHSEDIFRKNLASAISTAIFSGETRRDLFLTPIFVDEHHRVAYSEDAEKQLKSVSDRNFLQEGRGVVEVDRKRWETAQRFEHISWMTGGGLDRQEDRNREHRRGFDEYAPLCGRQFDHALEIGCGPFTNIVHIAKQVRIGHITLMDPLVEQYLEHPNCAYKHKRLGGVLGKKVETVPLPAEEYQPDHLYDLVVMINVLEHCYSMPRVFDKVLSLMPRGGVFAFHDKLIPDLKVNEFVEKVYDAGHPLRIAGSAVESYLDENFTCSYEKRVMIPSSLGYFEGLYFIGEKK